MNEFDDNDHLLFIIYKRFEDALIGYEKDCVIIENAQAKTPNCPSVIEAKLRQENMVAQWQLDLKQMMKLKPQTKRGASAMNRILRLCFKYHLAEDKDVMDLVESHLASLDLFLEEDASPKLKKFRQLPGILRARLKSFRSLNKVNDLH